MTEDDVCRRLDPGEVIDAIEAGFRDRYLHVTIPPRTVASLGPDVFLAMSCIDAPGRSVGLKLVVVRAAPDASGERIHATYLLLDAATGAPRLQLPAGQLTAIRTAATSAVATRHLAPDRVETLGIFGTGRQAAAHLRVLPLVRAFARVLVCGRTPAQTEAFRRRHQPETPLPIAAADAQRCAAEADVLCTCTTAATPLFDGAWVRPGAHLNLVGAFQPETREADTATITRAAVFVDTRDGALAEAGDLLIPMRAGEPVRIVADLHELVSRGRPNLIEGDITVFKSVGCALEDLITAELLLPATSRST